MAVESRPSIRVGISGDKALLTIMDGGYGTILYAKDHDGEEVAMGNISEQRERGLKLALLLGWPFAVVDEDQMQRVRNARLALGILDELSEQITDEAA